MASIEKRLEKRLKTVSERRACICVKFPPMFIRGFPDRFILCPGGVTIFVEAKDAKLIPPPLQRYWHRVLRGLGFKVYVLNSVAVLKEIEEELDNIIMIYG